MSSFESSDDIIENENGSYHLVILAIVLLIASSLQETIAIARLKRDLLQFSGNIHFYKSGDKYVLFKAAEDCRQLDKSENIESSQFDELCNTTTD